MRDKEQLKTKILEVVKDNKPEIIPLNEVKNVLHIEKAELPEFQQAVRELENEGRIRMHITIP